MIDDGPMRSAARLSCHTQGEYHGRTRLSTVPKAFVHPSTSLDPLTPYYYTQCTMATQPTIQDILQVRSTVPKTWSMHHVFTQMSRPLLERILSTPRHFPYRGHSRRLCLRQRREEAR